MWIVGKLCSIPILLETVSATRWLPTISIGLVLAVLVIRVGQFLSAGIGFGLIARGLAGRATGNSATSTHGLESAMLTHFLIDALYFAALLPALFFGGVTVLLGVVIVFLVVLAPSTLVFLRSGREAQVAPG